MTFMSLMSKIRTASHYWPEGEGWTSPGSIQLQPLEAYQSIELAQWLKTNISTKLRNTYEKKSTEQSRVENRENAFLSISVGMVEVR